MWSFERRYVFSNTVDIILSKKSFCLRLILNKKLRMGQKYREYKNKNKHILWAAISSILLQKWIKEKGKVVKLLKYSAKILIPSYQKEILNKYNQIVLTPLYLSLPLYNKNNQDDQDHQDDQDDQNDQDHKDHKDNQDNQDNQDDQRTKVKKYKSLKSFFSIQECESTRVKSTRVQSTRVQ